MQKVNLSYLIGCKNDNRETINRLHIQKYPERYVGSEVLETLKKDAYTEIYINMWDGESMYQLPFKSSSPVATIQQIESFCNQAPKLTNETNFA